MRQSRAFLQTLRAAPADAEVPSHVLLARAGFVHKVASGIYDYLPPLVRVLAKIERIVREAMDAAGGQEMHLPVLQPKELWEASGRWERYVADEILFRLEDRRGATLCLGPTHEEVVTRLVGDKVSSYRQLPLLLYQIQTKMRDEIRPRFGLMRGREFLMKDAYSFDVDLAGLCASYDAMDAAYRRVFERCGLAFLSVEADAGAIGGAGRSEEFMVLADTGEDEILHCEACGYGANVEKASSRVSPAPDGGAPRPLCRVATPNVRSVEELHGFFPDVPPARMVKTLCYAARYGDRVEDVAVLIRGDLALNEVKLVNALGALAVSLADDEQVRRMTGAEPGFAGPVGLAAHVRLLADATVEGMTNVLAGGCETDVHCLDVNLGRDVARPPFADLKAARAGEGCPSCGAPLLSARGIEVGHIFMLGTKYSEKMGATFAAEDGKSLPFVMGCYGIGVSRIAAATVEQHHDDAGIVWPASIAPWHAHVLCLSPRDERQAALAERLLGELEAAGVETLLDDREVSAGIKFKDADLVGIPFRVVVGRLAGEGKVELQARAGGEKEVVSAVDLAARVRARLAASV